MHPIFLWTLVMALHHLHHTGEPDVDLVRFTNPKHQRGKHFTRKGRRNLFASLALRVDIMTVCATSKSASEAAFYQCF